MYEVSMPVYTAQSNDRLYYQAFNEELDGMYNDANLPADEAWEALSLDLRQTKEAKNSLSRENSCVFLCTLLLGCTDLSIDILKGSQPKQNQKKKSKSLR